MINVSEPLTDNRTLVIMISICTSLFISGVLLTISFVMYKKQTAKDHAEEAEHQKRQQHLRYEISI